MMKHHTGLEQTLLLTFCLLLGHLVSPPDVVFIFQLGNIGTDHGLGSAKPPQHDRMEWVKSISEQISPLALSSGCP